MNGLKLYDAGYTDLVSVAPPGVTISPESQLKPEQLGKVPGKLGGQGWYGYHFVAAGAPSRADVERWEKWGANIGLMARRFPALDIDVSSPRLRDVVLGVAYDHLGIAPQRLSAGARRLLVYRCDEPFTRMALIATYNGTSHLIEMLAGDRQYLVAGTHPSGAQYRWLGQGLEDYDPADLPSVTRGSVVAFFDALQARLEAAGLQVERVGSGAQPAEAAPPQDDLLAPSIEQVRELVRTLPNDENTAPDWDTWIKVGHAIKAATGEDAEGEEIFLEWTSRCTRVAPADQDEASAQYGRMRAPHRVGWTWLQELAEAAGTGYVAAQDEFSADPDATAPEPASEQDGPRGLPNELTDEGVVRWLLPALRNQLRYAPASKGWYVWRGHRWELDGVMAHEKLIRRQLTRLCTLLRERAAAAPTKEEGAEFRLAAKTYQGARTIAGVVGLVRSQLAVMPDAFDTDPWALNTPGGVIDLRSGAVSPCSPEAMHARSTLVAPVAGPTPLWSRFLHDATGGDGELQTYVRRMLGYALTGDVSEKAIWYAWGSESDTGKSTLIRTVTKLFGSYADSVAPDVFLKASGDRIPAELARMPGVRLVTATEPAHGKAWDEQRVKSITGGDEIEVRFLYGQPFVYQPHFKILIVGNSEPEIKSVDSAMLRRIHIVPLNVPVPRERQIANLSQRMIAEEGPAILAWIVEGCAEWRREGLSTAGAVAARTEEYAEDEDVIGAWVREECEIVADAVTPRQELYVAYSAYCKARGEDPGKLKQFKRTMYPVAKKYSLREVKPANGQRGYRGIRLRSLVEDEGDF